MWTKMMSGPRKKAPKTIAVIDPDRCFGAFACSICQAACPVAGCIVEEKDRDGRMVCAVRADLCIGCGLCVTLGNPTAPQIREFGCPPDYDAINMMPYEYCGEDPRGVGEGRDDDDRCGLAVGSKFPFRFHARASNLPNLEPGTGTRAYHPQQSVLNPHPAHRHTACILYISAPQRSQTIWSSFVSHFGGSKADLIGVIGSFLGVSGM